ncbi:MAG: hypothetical protein DRJ63_07960 [Thermoprotei archaeon]|nr:MAG: hypothetical protein DRJ63_07960 [Thermoprotei archaeon]
MKKALAWLLARIQKSTGMPTVHIAVPKILLTVLLAELQRKLSSPREINRTLHKYGIWGGSICLVSMARPEDLQKIFPRDHRVEKVADFMEIYGKIAWYLFAGHMPSMEIKIIKLSKGPALKGTIISDPRKETFVKDILSPRGVSPYYVCSGAYEAATAIAFRILKVDNKWWSVWRPLLDKEGLVGFYIWKENPVNEVVEIIEKEEPHFFKDVTLEDSAQYIKSYIGVDILS